MIVTASQSPSCCNGTIGCPNPLQMHVCATPVPQPPLNDMINHPAHYTSHKSGVECVEIAECLTFNLGNAFKYLFRRNNKGSSVADVAKAQWYINRELERVRPYVFGGRSPAPFDLAVKVGRVIAHEPSHVGRALQHIVAASFIDDRGKIKTELELALGEIEQGAGT